MTDANLQVKKIKKQIHLEQLLLLDQRVPHRLPAAQEERLHQGLQPPPIARQLDQGFGGHGGGRVIRRRVLRGRTGKALNRNTIAIKDMKLQLKEGMQTCVRSQ